MPVIGGAIGSAPLGGLPSSDAPETFLLPFATVCTFYTYPVTVTFGPVCQRIVDCPVDYFVYIDVS